MADRGFGRIEMSADTSRAQWQAQLDTATATERVAERQVQLLRAQRNVIDAQLGDEIRKRDDATREILAAEKMLENLKVDQ